MKCNVGGADMIARLVIGAVLLVVGVVVPMSIVWQAIVLAVAAIVLVTGIVHYCPANALLGLDSCARHRQQSHESHSPSK